jgi:hypothetical protein
MTKVEVVVLVVGIAFATGCDKKSSPESEPSKASEPTPKAPAATPPADTKQTFRRKPIPRPVWYCGRLDELSKHHVRRVDDKPDPLRDGDRLKMMTVAETEMELDRVQAVVHDVTGDGKLDLLVEYDCEPDQDCAGGALWVQCKEEGVYGTAFESLGMPELAEGTSGVEGAMWRDLRAAVEDEDEDENCELHGTFRFDGQRYLVSPGTSQRKCN